MPLVELVGLQPTFLAPDIVASIAKGEQPATLTAKRMFTGVTYLASNAFLSTGGELRVLIRYSTQSTGIVLAARR